MEEVILPRINLVQGIGDLSNIYNKGEIVLNKELVIYKPKKGEDKNHEALEITVVGFFPTRWTERVSGGALGRLFDTAAQVVAAGGTTDYNTAMKAEKDGNDIPYFQQLATALILIKKPSFVNDDGIYFSEQIGEDSYTFALWSMKGSAYTSGAKVLKTARKMGFLKGGYPKFSWKLDTQVKAFGTGNSAVVPVLRPGSKHSEDFLESVRAVFGGQNSENAKGSLE
jgi:hypothetical protein